jgi:hypothetical protein
MHQIITMDLPFEGANAEGVEKSERKNYPWWKAKKWSLHIANRMFSRYGNPKMCKPEYKEFATAFKSECAGAFLETDAGFAQRGFEKFIRPGPRREFSAAVPHDGGELGVDVQATQTAHAECVVFHRVPAGVPQRGGPGAVGKRPARVHPQGVRHHRGHVLA